MQVAGAQIAHRWARLFVLVDIEEIHICTSFFQIYFVQIHTVCTLKELIDLKLRPVEVGLDNIQRELSEVKDMLRTLLNAKHK